MKLEKAKNTVRCLRTGADRAVGVGCASLGAARVSTWATQPRLWIPSRGLEDCASEAVR